MLSNKHILFTIMIIIFSSCLILFSIFYRSEKTYGIEESLSVYEKIAAGQPIRYLVIGDSIGRGSGAEVPELRWFKQLEQMIAAKFGVDMTGEYIVQGGATAFEGLYNLTHSLPTQGHDIVFIVFGENDRKYMNSADFAITYEALIRKAKTLNPNADIVTITESSLSFEDFAAKIKEISAYYRTTHIDMRPVFQQSGLSVDQLTKDQVHPNGMGYKLYAEQIVTFIDENVKNRKMAVPLPQAINEDANLSLRSQIQPTAIHGFTKKKSHYRSDEQGSYVEYSFRGNILGVSLERSPEGGRVDVYVDGKQLSSISTWWPFTKQRYLFIKNNLDNGPHMVRFEVAGAASKNNTSGESSVRISAIITN
jgi:lysophospholipase L1-like esterase